MEYDRYYIYGVILSDRAVADNEQTRFAPGLGNLYCNYLVERIGQIDRSIIIVRSIVYNGDRSERK